MIGFGLFDASVTRYGEISPLWQKFMNLCQMVEGLFSFRQNFGNFLMFIGSFSKWYINGQILKNNVTILPHCLMPTLPQSFLHAASCLIVQNMSSRDDVSVCQFLNSWYCKSLSWVKKLLKYTFQDRKTFLVIKNWFIHSFSRLLWYFLKRYIKKSFWNLNRLLKTCKLDTTLVAYQLQSQRPTNEVKVEVKCS